MCLPGCIESVKNRLRRDAANGVVPDGRRRFLKMAGAGLAAAGGMATLAARAEERKFTRVVDLTHSLSDAFPTFGGTPGISLKSLFNFADNGFNMNEWTLNEHTGTHMDAPLHFSADGQTAEEVPVESLVLPLVVVDIRAKAETDDDAQVTPDDLKDWEAEHGPIPAGSCVAMSSGWAAHVGGDKFRNADAEGKLHFPGFHVEAAEMMMGRDVVGMAVDTLSIDYGPSQDFATHYAWLPTNRWGMECVANLDELPPTGATIVAGAPKIIGASGGPSRVIALV